MGDNNVRFHLNKSDYNHRWILFTFCIWVNTGSYYCFDHPAALHNSLKEHFKGPIIISL